MAAAKPKCLKCGAALSGAINERNDTICPKCGRRYRLTPDRSAILGAETVLAVQSVKQGIAARKAAKGE